MNAYVYRAALYCEDCGVKIALDLRGDEPRDHAFELTDSATWPQGPYPNGAGEADTPQDCGTCGVFLENPLTVDGAVYVRERLSDPTWVIDSSAAKVWRDFYVTELARC